MSQAAKKFINNRNNPLALTQRRVDEIFSYIAYCHEILISDSITYSRKWVRENTTDKYENFLKKRLVHDYLKKKKTSFLFGSKIEDILFECEPEMPYTFFSHEKQKTIEANDRIDIKVNRIGLQEAWKGIEDQNIYFAIECKILDKLSDNVAYLNDMQKFCDRNHLQPRLPVEGMIAFKENPSPGVPEFVADLNDRLQSNSRIESIQQLKERAAAKLLCQYYESRHRRNFEKRPDFFICHLYLDYSQLITA